MFKWLRERQSLRNHIAQLKHNIKQLEDELYNKEEAYRVIQKQLLDAKQEIEHLHDVVAKGSDMAKKGLEAVAKLAGEAARLDGELEETKLELESVKRINAKLLASTPTSAESDEALAREVKAIQIKASQATAEAAFWREQAKTLQNQLQQAMRIQSDMVVGLADRPGCESLLEIAQEIKALRDEPLTTVAAVDALIASQKPDTQGDYTAVCQDREDMQCLSKP